MSTTDRLTSTDAAFLYFERPVHRLHVGCVLLLDGPVPFEEFREMTVERLRQVPRYFQRPVRPAFDWALPTWEPAERFDARQHIRHVGVPPPGGEAELHALVDEIIATPLDPDSPLWETYLIDGLADGRAAVVNKLHHCMVDGVSGAQLLELLSDAAPEPAAPIPAPGSPAHGSGGARPWSTQAAMEAASTLTRWMLEPSSQLPFNTAISSDRRVRWTTLGLDRILAVRGAVGCKVNDVVLAIITAGLRAWLLEHGLQTESLCVRAMVPVSVRTDRERMTLGNLVSAMFPVLPADVASPVERLRKIAAQMAALKERGQANATGLLLSLAGFLPAPVSALLGRLVPSWPMINVVCTNVPGPREPRSILGRRILEMHPVVPLFEGLGLNFAIMSYGDRLSVAAAADPALVPDVDQIAAAIGAELDILIADLGLAPASGIAAPLSATPRVADLMSSPVQSLSPHSSLADAWQLMRSARIRHLPVVDELGRPIGLVTHRDLLGAAPSAVAEPQEASRVQILGWLTAREVMETHLIVAAPDEPAAAAGQRMLRAKIGCVPVVDTTGRLVGIVTEEDFLRWATAHMPTPVREPHAA